jgi:hypothetical protein
MKKTIISIFALFAVGAGISFAQEEEKGKDAKDRLSEIEQMTVDVKKHKSASSENDVFEVNAVAHAGFGAHKVEGDAFRNKFGKSYELFVNAFELSFNPVPFLSVNAGLDLKWNRFVSETSQFMVKDGKFDIFTTATAVPLNNLRSRMCGFALSVPATLSINLGDTHLKFGVEAAYNVNRYNKAKSSYSVDKNATFDASDHIIATRGGEFEKFVISYIASVDFDGLGLYYKYCPESIVPGSDIIKSYQTVGIVLSM